MADYLVVVLVALVALVVAGAFLYIGGFLVSMLAVLVTVPINRYKQHHHHRPMAA